MKDSVKRVGAVCHRAVEFTTTVSGEISGNALAEKKEGDEAGTRRDAVWSVRPGKRLLRVPGVDLVDPRNI